MLKIWIFEIFLKIWIWIRTKIQNLWIRTYSGGLLITDPTNADQQRCFYCSCTGNEMDPFRIRKQLSIRIRVLFTFKCMRILMVSLRINKTCSYEFYLRYRCRLHMLASAPPPPPPHPAEVDPYLNTSLVTRRGNLPP